MMKALIVAVALVSACGAKKTGDTGGSGSGSGSGSGVTAPDTLVTGSGSGSGSAAMVDPNAKKCPPGNVLKGDACTPMITAEKVDAIAQQQTRLDDLSKLLDKTDEVAAPIEFLDAIRQLDEWKQLTAKNDKLKAVEQFVAILAEGVKQLHALQAGLKDGSIHLNNIKGELDTIMKDTGAAKKLEDVQAQVKKEIQATVDSLTKQLVAVIQQFVVPVKGQLEDVSELVLGACVIAKNSGASEKLKDLCTKARDIFKKADRFLDDFQAKPGELINALVAQLESQLGDLVDSGTKQVLDAAQQAVNDALKLPPAPAGSGSGSGSAKK